MDGFVELDFQAAILSQGLSRRSISKADARKPGLLNWTGKEIRLQPKSESLETANQAARRSRKSGQTIDKGYFTNYGFKQASACEIFCFDPEKARPKDSPFLYR